MLNCLNSIKYGLFWCSIWNFLTQILPLYSMSLSLPQTCIAFLDVKAQCIAYQFEKLFGEITLLFINKILTFCNLIKDAFDGCE